MAENKNAQRTLDGKWAMECAACGGSFEASRSDARTCSAACRRALSRGGYKTPDCPDHGTRACVRKSYGTRWVCTRTWKTFQK